MTTRTNKIVHNVDVGDAKPIKQHPYRSNPVKQEILKEEIQYLLENDFIEPAKSEWSSSCILFSKPDGSFRMCRAYRKVNNCTKTDTFSIPRIDDCIDTIGLLKGFCQFPLTEKAKEISTFVTQNGVSSIK